MHKKQNPGTPAVLLKSEKSKSRWFIIKFLTVRESLCALAVIFCTCAASSAQTITLSQVLDSIELNNPAVLSFENKINSANELTRGALALDVLRAAVEFDDTPYDLEPGKNVVKFKLFQEFINPEKLKAKRNYLSSLANIEIYDREGLKNTLFSIARENYYERYVSEKRILVLEENITLLRVMTEVNKKQLAVSSNSDLAAIYKLRARIALAENMMWHEQNLIKTLNAELNYLMNGELNRAFSIDTNELIKDYRAGMLLKDSLAFIRSDILKMTSEIQSMQLNRLRLQALSKPDFRLAASHYYFPREKDLFSIEAMISIPIVPWSSKGYKSEVKSAEYRVIGMEQDRQAMLNSAFNSVNMLLIEMNSEFIEIANYTEKIIPAYRKSLDATILSFSQNTTDLTMVLLAYDDLQMIQEKYLEHLAVLLKVQSQYEKEIQIR